MTQRVPYDLLASDAQMAMVPFRNKIINGNFDVWQRGTSFTTGTIYTADRWRAAGATGQTVTRVADHPTMGTNGFCAEITNTSGSQWIDQRIESLNARDLIGKQVTVSAFFKSISAGGGCQVVVSSANAVDDFTNTTNLVVSSLTSPTGWTQVSRTFTATDACANGIQVRIVTSGGAGGAATVRLAMVQLEVGSVATPFEHRPFGTELALCQRYFERIAVTAGGSSVPFPGVGYAHSTTAAFAYVYPKVQKRVTQTPTCSAGTTFVTLQGAASLNQCTNATVGNVGDGVALLSLTVASGLTSGQPLFVYAMQNQTAVVDFPAEL